MGLHYSAGAGQSLFSHRLLRTMWKSSRYILDAFAGEYDGRLLLESNGPNEAGIFRRLDKLRDRCFPDDPASGAHRAYEAVDKEEDRSGVLTVLVSSGTCGGDYQDIRYEGAESSIGLHM